MNMEQLNEIRQLNQQLETFKQKYLSVSAQYEQTEMTISKQKFLNEKLRQALVQLNNELEKEKEKSLRFSKNIEELQKKSQQTIDSAEVEELKQLIENQLYFLEKNKKDHEYELYQSQQKYAELNIEMQNQKELLDQYQEKIQNYDGYISEIKQHTNEEYAKIQEEYDKKLQDLTIENEKLQELISILEQYQVQYVDMQQEYELLQQKMAYLMEQYSDKEVDFEDEITTLKAQMDCVREDLVVQKQLIEKKQQYIEEVELQKAEVNRQLETVQMRLAQLENENLEEKIASNDLKEKLYQYELNIKQLNEQLQKIQQNLQPIRQNMNDSSDKEMGLGGNVKTLQSKLEHSVEQREQQQQFIDEKMHLIGQMEKENMDLKDQLSNATILLGGLENNRGETALLEEQIAQQQVEFERQLEELKSVQTIELPATNLDVHDEIESLKKQSVEQRVNERQYVDEIAFLNKKLAVLEEKLKLKLTKDTNKKIELITLDYEKMFEEELLVQ